MEELAPGIGPVDIGQGHLSLIFPPYQYLLHLGCEIGYCITFLAELSGKRDRGFVSQFDMGHLEKKNDYRIL